jgi:undecaprenyl-phosphate 4-deoxy-4-formamido-L-arabinose transferase
VSALGAILAVVGFVLGVVLVALKVAGSAVPQGWTSLAVIMLFSAGAILFALGIVAEYLGVTVNMAMGKPLYVIVADSADGPLGRRQGADARRP